MCVLAIKAAGTEQLPSKWQLLCFLIILPWCWERLSPAPHSRSRGGNEAAHSVKATVS